MLHHDILIIIACCFAVATFCQWLAWRLHQPAIIFLLLSGICAGPVLHLLNPAELLGDLFSPFISLSVAIILFEGAITLRFREMAGLQKVVRNMLSFGLLSTWAITACAARFWVELPWGLAFLFGAITVVTGPTVIAPLLRTVRPTPAVSSILRWEGIVIDPIGASLAVLVYEFVISGGDGQAFGHTLLTFAEILLAGGLAGLGWGYFHGLALRNGWLPDFLQNVATLGTVFCCFVMADTVQPESGLVAVTVLGILLGNMKDVDLEEILHFKESLSVLLISLLFLMLAARLDVGALKEMGWKALLVFVAVQFLARPVNVMLSTLGSRLSMGERYLLSWIAPRGIVAAAIASLFALKLGQLGYEEARLLPPLTFSVIIGTVVLQSLTAGPLARRLGVALPEPRGFLITGANLVARTIAQALTENGVRVLLADSSWQRIGKARIEGMETYLGNPISEHADRHMNLAGIGRMLAMSPYESENAAAVMHYRMELGRSNVYYLPSRPENEEAAVMKLAPQRRGRPLFSRSVTFARIASSIARGAEIRTTRLTEQFSYSRFRELHGERALVLFVIDLKGEIRPVDHSDRNGAVQPEAGWALISLFEPDGE